MKRIVLACLVLSACGSSPTAPTPPPPLPHLSGQYTGILTITSCVESGAAVGSNFCANLGSTSNHSFTPTQSGTAVSGTIGIGTITVTVTGNVGTDQIVSVAGSGPIATVATLNLTTWRGTVSGVSITGTTTFTILTVTPPGSATVQGTFTLFR